MRKSKDPKIAKIAIDDSWTLVTCNSDDFRPRPGSRAKSPCFVGVELHAGLICLNLPGKRDRAIQKTYFKAALRKIEGAFELTNEIVEVSPKPDNLKEIQVIRYNFPK